MKEGPLTGNLVVMSHEDKVGKGMILQRTKSDADLQLQNIYI